VGGIKGTVLIKRFNEKPIEKINRTVSNFHKIINKPLWHLMTCLALSGPGNLNVFPVHVKKGEKYESGRSN
jgi:hypothetical protein